MAAGASTGRSTSAHGAQAPFLLALLDSCFLSRASCINRAVMVNPLVHAQAPVAAISEIPFDRLPGRQAEQRRTDGIQDGHAACAAARLLRIDEVEVPFSAGSFIGIEHLSVHCHGMRD